MKKRIYIVFSFFIAILSYSQTVEVTYVENKIVSKEKLEEMPEFLRATALAKHKYTLQCTKGVSMYKNSVETKNTDSSSTTESEDSSDSGTIKKEENNYRVTTKNLEKFYYKDQNKDLFLFNVYNLKRDIYGRGPIVNWDWEIANETKIINGFTCKKAVTNKYGYPYTAWFTEDIPVNAGPERFNGLPGLILYVANAYTEYTATNIKTIKEDTQLVEPKIPSGTMTFDEYVLLMDSKIKELKDRGNSTTTETNGNTTTTRSVIKLN